jgi:hypothetical protein
LIGARHFRGNGAIAHYDIEFLSGFGLAGENLNVWIQIQGAFQKQVIGRRARRKSGAAHPNAHTPRCPI